MSNQSSIKEPGNMLTCTIKLDNSPWFRVQCSDDTKFRAALNGIRAIPKKDILYETWYKKWICRIEHFKTIKKILLQLYDECWLEENGKRERIKEIQAPQCQKEKETRETVDPEQLSLFG